MYHIFCIYSSVEEHLGSFQLLVIINKAAMNIVEHVSLLQVGTSSGYMPRRGIAGSTSSTMSRFLRNCQTDFQRGCTSLQSHQQWRSVPLSPHPQQCLGFGDCIWDGSFLSISSLKVSNHLYKVIFKVIFLCYSCC